MANTSMNASARISTWQRNQAGAYDRSDAGGGPRPNAQARVQWLEDGVWRGGYTVHRTAAATRTVEEAIRKAQTRYPAYRVVEVAPPPPDSPEGARRAAGLARLAVLRAKAPPKTPRPCTCGCGGQTRGGRFLPGHDAKFHSAQKKTKEASHGKR